MLTPANAAGHRATYHADGEQRVTILRCLTPDVDPDLAEFAIEFEVEFANRSRAVVPMSTLQPE